LWPDLFLHPDSSEDILESLLPIGDQESEPDWLSAQVGRISELSKRLDTLAEERVKAPKIKGG